MTGYIIRRVGQAVVVVLGVTLIAFFLEHLIPGGIARSILGPRATPGGIAAWNKQNGYDSPLWYQYWVFLDHLVHGNLGFSYKLNRSVDSIIASDLPRDVLLVGTSLVLAVVIAVPVGVMQAVKRNRTFDYAGTTTAFVLYSMPSYALGLDPHRVVCHNHQGFTRPRHRRGPRSGRCSPTRPGWCSPWLL